MNVSDRLIVALDLPRIEEAELITQRLGHMVGFYKIGYQLISIGGCDLARRLSAAGNRVFLDFKFLDIGATVERGVRSALTLGGDFITIHAERDALQGAIAGRGDDPRLKILGVTALTSWDQSSLARQGIETALDTFVLRRTELVLNEGGDGVIASAQEAKAIRRRFGNDLIIVTPGIRPAGSDRDDQRRVTAPGDAIRAGADHLVVGRPILTAPDPAAVIRDIQAEIEAALDPVIE